MAFNNDDFHAPEELRTDEFLLRPILESDAALDYEAVMASREYLRTWEGTGWPAEATRSRGWRSCSTPSATQRTATGPG